MSARAESQNDTTPSDPCDDDTNDGKFVLETRRHIEAGMEKLRNGAFSDVQIKVLDHEDLINAHRAVLCVHSNYFRSWFERNPTSTTASSTVETHSRFETMSLLLDYMYLGRVEISPTFILELVHETDFYDVGELRDDLMGLLSTEISLDTVLPCFRYAAQFAHNDLHTLCVRFVERNADLVLPKWTSIMAATDGAGEDAETRYACNMLLDLGDDSVRAITMSDNLRSTEADVLSFVLQWCWTSASDPRVAPVSDDENKMALRRFVDLSDVVRWSHLRNIEVEVACKPHTFVSSERLCALGDRKGRRQPPRASPAMRWSESAAPGLALDPHRVQVERIEAFASNAKIIKGDITALADYRFDPGEVKCCYEVVVEKSRCGQVCLGLWKAEAISDETSMYTFTNPSSYSIDLFSGNIFIGEDFAPFLESRVVQGSTVALISNAEGDIFVEINGVNQGRAFTGLKGSYVPSVTLNGTGDVVALTQRSGRIHGADGGMPSEQDDASALR